ncbi:hypothetical protein JG687_00019666, partial [Phytophthora cactorum]
MGWAAARVFLLTSALRIPLYWKILHNYVLRLSAIRFFDKNERQVPPKRADIVGITLSGAKNNQFGRQEIRFHHKSADKLICPVRGARWVLKGAAFFGRWPDDPALSTHAGGITSESISATIKAAAAQYGLDPGRFSTHSVRIGGATSLLNSGADRLEIKLLGRWLSNAFEDYPVLSAKGSA